MNNVKDSIGWADKSWSPVTGCRHGCPYCYARRMAKRLAGRYGYPKDNPFQPTFHPDRLDEPAKCKKPSRIFVSSMGDLWGEWVPIDWQERVLLKTTWVRARHHRFLFLTKNPKGYRRFNWQGRFREQLWIGATITNQADADKRIPELLETGGNTFVSLEPLLGPVDMDLWQYPAEPGEDSGVGFVPCACGGHFIGLGSASCLRWIIIGAQTGPGAVKPDRKWIVEIIGQADAAGIPIYIKANITKIWPDLNFREFPEGLKLEGDA